MPKRSPELNVMDYAVWADVNRRMRKQEKKWKASDAEFVCMDMGQCGRRF